MDSGGEPPAAQPDGGERRPSVGHVHLRVRHLDRSVRFYRGVLDMCVTERRPRIAFLSFGDRHHDLALQSVGESAPGPGTGVGLYHAAFEVADAAALRSVYEQLRERDVAVSTVDHGISEALYFEDPDGNGLEVYRDTRAERGQWEWGGESGSFDPLEGN